MDSKIKEKLIEMMAIPLTGVIGLLLLKTIPPEFAERNKDLIQFLIQMLAAGFVLLIFIVANYRRRKVYRPGLTLLPKGIVKREGFLLSWWQMVLFGTLGFVIVWEVAGFLVGIAAALIFGQITYDALFPAILLVASFIAFFLGRWVGTRAHASGVLALVTILLVGRMVILVIDVLLLPFITAENVELGDVLIEPLFLISGVNLLIFGGLGYWRGSKARASAYLWYLVNSLPVDTQQSIVDLVYEEARAVAAQLAAQSTQPAQA